MCKIFLSVGAGPGIGLATARRFAREGFDVVLASRDHVNKLPVRAVLTAIQCHEVEVAEPAADVRKVSAEPPVSLAEALGRAVQPTNWFGLSLR